MSDHMAALFLCQRQTQNDVLPDKCMAQVIEIKGLDEVMKSVDSMTERNIEKDVRKIVRYVLQRAAKELRKDAHAILPNDPRKSYKAVRSAVYKRLLGGQVNILSRRKNNGRMYVGHPQRKLRLGQRGGNRMTRSKRTNQVDSYYGSDRGFILRFLNAGTDPRYAGTRDGNMKHAFRGRLTATDWFGTASQKELEEASGMFADLVERAIEELWSKGQITQQYNG